MCQNKKPPTVYRRSRGRSCRSSGVAPCGDCGATRHSIALRFQVLCLGHQQWHIELVRSATQRTVVMKENCALLRPIIQSTSCFIRVYLTSNF